MTTITVSIRLTVAVLAAILAFRFRWTIAPSHEERRLAAACGVSITKRWPLGTWLVRTCMIGLAIYMVASVIQPFLDQ